jgi:hypothetical protein
VGIRIRQAIYALEVNGSPKLGYINEGTVAMLKSPYKLIHYIGYDNLDDGYELYNLKDDLLELKNVFEATREIVSELQREMLLETGPNLKQLDT